MNKVIRTFFFFSKRERIGVTVLLVFLVFIPFSKQKKALILQPLIRPLLY